MARLNDACARARARAGGRGGLSHAHGRSCVAASALGCGGELVAEGVALNKRLQVWRNAFLRVVGLCAFLCAGASRVGMHSRMCGGFSCRYAFPYMRGLV